MKQYDIMTAILLVLVLGWPQPSLGHVCSTACTCPGMGTSIAASAPAPSRTHCPEASVAPVALIAHVEGHPTHNAEATAEHSSAPSHEGVEHEAAALPAATAPCTMNACAQVFTSAPAHSFVALPLPVASFFPATRNDELVISLHTAPLFRPPRA